MNVRINQGYVITDSIHIGKAEFVIGEMSNTPAPFVTWECKDGNNYFWGHYTSNRYEALKDLCQRAEQEIDYLAAIGEIPPITSKKEQERER